MDVYSNDVIHAAKCNAKRKPDKNESNKFFLVNLLISFRWLIKMIGINGMAEMIIRAAAMTRESASFCANRMNIAAVEILMTPKNRI